VKTIQVELGARSYPIHIGPGLLGRAKLLAESVAATQVMIVSNETVAPLYLERVTAAFGDRDLRTVILPDGEQYKTIERMMQVIDALIEGEFHRDACLVALGGGVIGDLAGFAAACYQRGIDFLQLPTTLLAQVDSSVGGKTAVNHPKAKNMIGAFHQPVAVLADTETLRTLPQRELVAGLAEVIKYGLIEDIDFFAWLESNIDALIALDADALTYAIGRCCAIKADIVADDERERGRRALLNLGHTFGHAIEALGGYGHWLHGEAVAIGMQMAAEASAALGSITAADCDRVRTLLLRAKLPVRADGLDAQAIMQRMRLDKKAGSGGLRVVLLERLGRAVVTQAPDEAVLRAAIASGLEIAV
jgi:3-dehydroquinate synthase